MMLPQNREREIYECYCELDIQGFEHKQDKEITGLQIPYIVTIDKSSRKALAVVRNFDEDDQELPTGSKAFRQISVRPRHRILRHRAAAHLGQLHERDHGGVALDAR